MRCRIFSGTCHPVLTQAIGDHLGLPLEPAIVERFTDGDVRVELGTGVRGDDVYVVQPTPSIPRSDNLMELLVIIDALKRSAAGRITAVIPYLGYSCQDRRDKPHVPISAALVADLIAAAGANRVLLFEIHNQTTLGFFDKMCVSVDHLYGAPVLIPACRELGVNRDEWVVVSSDAGRVAATRKFAQLLLKGLPVAIVDKRRSGPHETEVMNVIGEVKDKNLILFDDMIRTATTMVEDVHALVERGAKRVISCVSHLICAGDAVKNIVASKVELVIGTDSLPFQVPVDHQDTFKRVTIGPLLAKAIGKINRDESVTALLAM